MGIGAVVGAMLAGAAVGGYAKFVRYPQIAEQARQGYVALAEKLSLEAQLAEYQRQHVAATQAVDAALKKAGEAKQEAADAQARYDALVASDTDDDGGRFTRGDIEWLRNH